jgi:PKHD-type hydroxylase
MILFNSKTLKQNPFYTIQKNLFSKGECETIKEFYPLLTQNKINPSLTGGGILNKVKRLSENVWLPFEGDFAWVYGRIAEGAKQCNVWDFDLTGFLENIQLAHYRQDSHYGWHVDAGTDQMSLRKLSAIIQLSDPSEYEGGDLEFFMEQKDDELKTQGHCIFFPSYTVHRVCPVISGQRFSAVIWISGSPYK